MTAVPASDMSPLRYLSCMKQGLEGLPAEPTTSPEDFGVLQTIKVEVKGTLKTGQTSCTDPYRSRHQVGEF